MYAEDARTTGGIRAEHEGNEYARNMKAAQTRGRAGVRSRAADKRRPRSAGIMETTMKTLIKRILSPAAARALTVLTAVCLIFCAAGCNKNTPIENGYTQYNEIVIETPAVSPAAVDTEIDPGDADPSFDSGSAVNIILSGNGAGTEGKGVSFENGTVTVSAAGTYVIKGELESGGITVRASKEDDVKLVLDGVNISNSGFAALYVFSADNVIVTLAEGSENYLSSSGDFSQIDENNVNACVYSKDDIAFNGGGTLVVNCESGHGIAAKDDMAVSGTVMRITAGGHGINVNDSLKIDGASMTVRSGKDAIHCENGEDAGLGNVYVSKGSFTFVTEGDGIDASGIVRIDGGTFDVESGNYRDPEQSADFGEIGFGGFGGRGSGFGGWGGGSSAASETDSVSTKGIKADKEVDIMGGSFRLVCEDDAIHSDGRVFIGGGSFDISTGDDGIHADGEIMIYTPDGCDVKINNSYEGIEAPVITVNAGPGSIYVNATDDGFNASNGQGEGGFGGFGGFGGRGQGASGQTSGDSVILTFLSGTVTVNSGGDGIDSNGTVEVKGGLIRVSGPTSNNNGALDYGYKAVITGGTFIACGSSGMAQNFGSGSTQGSILLNCGSVEGGTEVRVTDGGEVIVSFTPAKQFGSILVSTPEMKAGGTYTVSAGSFSSEIKLTSLIYNGGGGTGPGGQGGSQGGNPGGMGPGGQGGSQGGNPGGMGPGGQGGSQGGTETEAPGGSAGEGDPGGMGSGDVAPGDFGQLNPGRSS